MPYVELHARSAFSFLDGASNPEQLARVCAERGLPAMALLDRDGVHGAPRFHMAAKKLGLRAHIGSEITIRNSPPRHEDTKKAISSWSLALGRHDPLQAPNANCQQPSAAFVSSGLRGEQFSRIPLIAADRTGYQNLCRLITRMKLRAPKVPLESRPETIAAATLDEVAEHSAGLICLTGGDEGPLATALATGGIDEARNVAERLIAIFGREQVYVELQRHYDRAEEARNRALVDIARRLHLPLVATNGVRHATAQGRELADVFTCIRNHHTLDTAGRLLARNAERHLKSAAEMQRLFADLPEAVAATGEISSRLKFTLADLGYEFPRYPIPEGETMASFLRKRTDEGARERYLTRSRNLADRQLWTRARRQIERELALIEKLGLEGYFLIVWDIVQFCRREGILVQGRGSAANSAVCYSLGLTAVDPISMGLLFERFLSEERGEWPDIDLDLPSGDRRERVIQHVYERYGKRGAAMTANVITYRGRLAAREMGKVLGLDADTTGRLATLVGSWEYKDPDDTLARQFREAGFDLRLGPIRKFFDLCLAVQDLPRHLGQHSGGMVICQGQLDSVVPLEPASMPNRVVVQWDKDDCADMGIIKVDLLGLGMMAVLEESLVLIRDHHQEEVDLAQLPPNDPPVYAALQKADTVGMFQIESRAQMSCLPRLQPKNFYDIVVQVAIIRPGPIVGNMVNPFLKRRQGREPVAYPHPSLEPVLERTLGVPLFQEQLLRMAMIAAGFSGGEAEELRRAFGFKRAESRMADIEGKLRAGMTHNGISGPAQDSIVQAITSFALYGFPESHAASFALIAYASAWLKTHYLAAFTAALLNNQPMGFYHPATLVKDAQRHGLRVLPIDVLRSDWPCTLEILPNCRTAKLPNLKSVDRPIGSSVDRSGSPEFTDSRPLTTGHSNSAVPQFGNSAMTLRLGLRYVRGLRQEPAEALVRARRMRPFSTIDELVRRVPELNKSELAILAEIGALNSVASITNHQSPINNFADPWPFGRLDPRCHPEDAVGAALRREAKRDARIHSLPNRLTAELPNQGSVDRSMGSSVDLSGLSMNRCADQSISRSSDFGNSAIRQFGNAFHRRDALWQIEYAVRRPGPLFDEIHHPDESSPLARMNDEERLVADFRGTGLTVGPHPMQFRRNELDRMGVRRAAELVKLPQGRRVRAAGCVIARQRPGTAHGFLFLSLEDETGIANAIVQPDLYQQNRALLVRERFLMVEGPLQNQDGVISVRADRVSPLRISQAETRSHDFH